VSSAYVRLLPTRSNDWSPATHQEPSVLKKLTWNLGGAEDTWGARATGGQTAGNYDELVGGELRRTRQRGTRDLGSVHLGMPSSKPINNLGKPRRSRPMCSGSGAATRAHGDENPAPHGGDDAHLFPHFS
jgi:hypothetical protein